MNEREQSAGVNATASRPSPIEYTSPDQFLQKVEIYRGRHSTVWSCICRDTAMPLVVKAYQKNKMHARHFKNVRRELKILQLFTRLGFSGVVTLLGTFETSEHIYIIMESCSRGDLFKHLLRQGGTIEEPKVCTEVVIPLLLTLAFLHANAIIHRDIKPENLFFGQDGSLKLGDFGLAVNFHDDKPISRVGTLDYMAPEVLAMPTPDQIAKGQIKTEDISCYNEKVDIWAVGILAYELIAGRPPFEVEDSDLTAHLIMTADVDRWPLTISGNCLNFIKSALVKKPEERPSADELLHHAWIRTYYRHPIEPSTPLKLRHTLTEEPTTPAQDSPSRPNRSISDEPPTPSGRSLDVHTMISPDNSLSPSLATWKIASSAGSGSEELPEWAVPGSSPEDLNNCAGDEATPAVPATQTQAVSPFCAVQHNNAFAVLDGNNVDSGSREADDADMGVQPRQASFSPAVIAVAYEHGSPEAASSSRGGRDPAPASMQASQRATNLPPLQIAFGAHHLVDNLSLLPHSATAVEAANNTSDWPGTVQMSRFMSAPHPMTMLELHGTLSSAQWLADEPGLRTSTANDASPSFRGRIKEYFYQHRQ
ncbi:hypothetical protein WJX72_003532 [[Myrmecia] bisecta]|uniref:Protein kinase domain-containing protein n=1 Tax=[Myrmecia] bisecta TaxID=41462 RepID=A0AAW1Q6D2_9CHLO